jgi:HSP20 family protein
MALPGRARVSRGEWDPLKELVGVQERMNKLFESALARTNFDSGGGAAGWTPVSDVFETTDSLVICMEVPGLDQRDLDVRVEADELLVGGEVRMDRQEPSEQFHRVERSYGRFARKFPLPSTVDRDGIEAVYRDGVLRIAMPKVETSSRRPIRVAVR